MNAQSIASALAYSASKRTEILPSDFEKSAASLKESIQAGRVWGLTFPSAQPKKRREPRAFTTDQKIKMVNKVNALRAGGMTLNDSLDEVGIDKGSYHPWGSKLGIKCGVKDDDTSKDLDILRMVESGVSILKACKHFKVNSTTWSSRTIRNGLRKPVERNKMTHKHVAQIEEINALIEQGGNPKAARDSVGMSYGQYKSYSERLKFTTI